MTNQKKPHIIGEVEPTAHELEMLRSHSFQRYFADRIKFHLGRHFAEVGFTGLEVKADWDMRAQAFAVSVVTSMHAVPREMLEIHKQWPATWWDAFKERWFPKWALRRWPVKYERLDVSKRIYGNLCPHLPCDDHRPHFEFLIATPNGQ